MERNIQRINGIKMDLGKVSDDEIESMMGHTWERLEASQADLEKLGIESARRFALDGLTRTLDCADGVARVYRLPSADQPTLFDDFDPLPEPPEAA